MATEYILQPGYDCGNVQFGLDVILRVLTRTIPDGNTGAVEPR